MTAPVTGGAAAGPSGPALEAMRRSFSWGNRHVMLPLLRRRLAAAWMGSPWGGYFLTLTTTGRRSGLPRQTPLNYAILDGHVYLLSGFGVRADWYRNLIADPRVTIALPGRIVQGTAAPVGDPAEAERAALAVARNCGFALVFEGVNPLTVTDEQLRTRLVGRPVVRVAAPEPVESGSHDPGSWTWLLPHVVAPLVLVGAARAVKAVSRRAP